VTSRLLVLPDSHPMGAEPVTGGDTSVTRALVEGDDYVSGGAGT
jgi:hypothetical protein